MKMEETNNAKSPQDFEEASNFVKCHKAIQIVCLRAATCVEKVLENWHTRMCSGKNALKRCTKSKKCEKNNGRPTEPRSCHNCQDWGTEIENMVFPPDSDVLDGLCWRNVSSTEFFKRAVAVAKVFVYTAPRERMNEITDFVNFDGGSLLMIMKTFSEFLEDAHQRSAKKERQDNESDTQSEFTLDSSESDAASSHSSETPDTKRKKEHVETINKVLRIRNKLCHIDVGSNLQIPEKQMDQYFTDISRLVFTMEKLGHLDHLETGHVNTEISKIRSRVTTEMVEDTRLELQKCSPSAAYENADKQLSALQQHITLVQVQVHQNQHMVKNVEKEIHYHINGDRNGLCMLTNGETNHRHEKHNEGLDAIPNFPYNQTKIKLCKEIKQEKLEEIKDLLLQDPDMGFGISEDRVQQIENVKGLLKCLEEHKLLGPCNLVFLPVLLCAVNCDELRNYVDNFAAHMKRNKMDPLVLCRVEKSADGMFLTELKIGGNKEYLYGGDIEDFRSRLGSQLSVPLKDVRFEAAGKGCFVIVFHLPDRVRGDLREAAISRALWLKEANIIGVHIEGEEYISLEGLDNIDVSDEHPGHQDDGTSDTLSHIESTSEERKLGSEKNVGASATWAQEEKTPEIELDELSYLELIDEMMGAVESVQRVEEYDARRPAQVPAFKQYVRKTQENITEVSRRFKKSAIERIRRGNGDDIFFAKQLLFGALNMYTKVIQWHSRFGVNSGLATKLLLERAECGLLLGNYSAEDFVEQEIFYDIAKKNAEEVLGRNDGNEVATVIRILAMLLTPNQNQSSDPQENGLRGVVRHIKSNISEQHQNRTTMKTVITILKDLLGPGVWEEVVPAKPPTNPGGSDSGLGSSISKSATTLSSKSKSKSSKKGKTREQGKRKKRLVSRQTDIQVGGQPRKRGTSTSTSVSKSEGDLESEFSFKVASDSSGSDNLECVYCNESFLDEDDREQHCATTAHKANVLNVEGEGRWRYRPPPPNVLDGKYQLCEQQTVSLCVLANACSKAHSKDELVEWQKRYTLRRERIAEAVKRKLHSKLDDIVAQLELTSDKTSVLSDIDPTGVTATCAEKLHQTIVISNNEDNDMQTFKWSFTVRTDQKKPLQTVGLLHDANRQNFSLDVTGNVEHPQIVTGKYLNVMKLDAGDGLSYHITATFQSKMLGEFKQWIVFDFGENPKLYKELTVRVVADEDSEDTTPDVLLEDLEWDWSANEFVPFRQRIRKPHSYPCCTAEIPAGPLGKDNYKECMHAALYSEESCRLDLLKRFGARTTMKLMNEISVRPLKYCQPEDATMMFGEIDITSKPLDDSPASQIIRDSQYSNVDFVKIKFADSDVIYEARINNDSNLDEMRGPQLLYVELSRRCVEDMLLSDGETREIHMQFVLERQLFEIMHKAVDDLDVTENMDFLFPPQNPNPALISPTAVKSRLNKWQECAARFMRCGGGSEDTTPLLLMFGPFGSGKTYTLAHTAMQILRDNNKPNRRDPIRPRILVCTHSNSAADLYITDFFADFARKTHVRMRREYAITHDVRNIPDKVRRFSNLENWRVSFRPEEVAKCQLVVTTTSTAARLSVDRFRGHFTHILIDEAAQVWETEAIIPLRLAGLGRHQTCVILAGDHRQMRPKVYSKDAVCAKFHQSLLQRVIEYSKLHDCRRYIQLTINYRNQQDILAFLSKTFYTDKEFKLAKKQHRHPDWYPLEFRAVIGEDRSTGNSFINELEAQEVCQRVETLVKKWPKELWGALENDIGILTPYMSQVRRIRQMLRRTKYGENVTVERVQNVQGKQYRVLIVCTVRTNQTLNNSTKHFETDGYLGFLSDWRQLNTAFSRAQSLLIVVGNPQSLCFVGRCCIVWRNYIDECSKNGSLYPDDLTLDQPQAAQSCVEFTKSNQAEISNAILTNQVDTWAPKSSDEHHGALTSKEEGTPLDFDDLDEDKKKDLILKWLVPQIEDDRCDNVELSDVSISTVTVEEDGYISFRIAGDDHTLNIAEKESSDDTIRCTFRVDFHRQMYAISEDHPSASKKILISTNSQRKTALDGDTVDVQIVHFGHDQDDQDHGKVVEVVRRRENMEGKMIVCFVDQYSDNLMVPLNQTLPKIIIRMLKEDRDKRKSGGLLSIPIYKRPTKEKTHGQQANPTWEHDRSVEVTNKDRGNKLFVVQWLDWKEKQYYPFGTVVDHIPHTGTLQDDLEILQRVYSVPTYLDNTCMRPTIPSEEIKRRRNFREKLSITIDPEFSEDMDDALSVEESRDGFSVWIHIADVTYFIRKESDVDRIARQRATSFYPHNQRPVHMLPPLYSTDLCSLVEGKERLTVSLNVLFDSDGNRKPDNRHITERYQRSVIKCTRNLHHGEVEDAIHDKAAIDVMGREVLGQILQLYKIASQQRQLRLGLRRFTQGCENPHPKAHLIVEEFMLIANSQVAKDLRRIDALKDFVPVRRHQPPVRQRFLTWKKDSEHLIKYSLNLASQEEWLFSRTTSRSISTAKPEETVKVLKHEWEKVKVLARSGTMKGFPDELAQMLCDDSMYPENAAVLADLHHMMPKSEYVPAGDFKDYDLGHTGLRLDKYTHFTSPIRRYIDIIVHRLLLSALANAEDIPYERGDIRQICQHCTVQTSKAKEFETRTRSAHLASEIQQSPVKLLAYVESVSDEGVMLSFQSYPTVNSAHPNNPVDFHILKPITQPTPESTTKRLTWKDRIYHMDADKSLSKQDYEENKKKADKTLNSLQFVDEIPGKQRMLMLKYIKNENTELLRRIVKETAQQMECDRRQRETKRKNMPPRFQAQIPPMVNEVTCMDGTFVQFKRPFTPGHVLQVQLQAGLRRGILCPRVGMVNLTPQLEVCIEHRTDPVSNFAAVVDAKPDRENIGKYQDTWIPILEMESTYNTVRSNDTITVHGVEIDWLQRNEDLLPCGSFSLPDDFCKPRHIKFFSKKDSQSKSCFLCIRYQSLEESYSYEYKPQGYDQTSLVPKENQDNTFVVHALVVDVNRPDTLDVAVDDDESAGESEDEDATWTVFFVVHQCKSLFPLQLLNTTKGSSPRCTIEIIQKSLSDSRLEEAVEQLDTSPALIQHICLHRALGTRDADPVELYADDYYEGNVQLLGDQHDINSEHTDQVIKYDTLELEEDEITKQLNDLGNNFEIEETIEGSPFHSMNPSQRLAITRAFLQPFTVIQGPPGTGKTVTGAYLVYFFTQLNSLLEMPKPKHRFHPVTQPQVLYCGPSNKSVDVITEYLRAFRNSLDKDGIQHNLSFIRVYSEGIEAQRYPINGMLNPMGKNATKYDLDKKVEEDSLHVKIRQNADSNPSAAFVVDFESKFGPNSREKPTPGMHDEYRKALMKAREREVTKYSILLCTCNTAGWRPVHKRTNIIECIVDEAGMCCEPETIVPLVSTKPKRIVLIGDHKQLRPIIKEQTAKQLGMDISLLESYSDRMEMLDTQYRMHPAICEFPSQEFYDGKLLTGRSRTSKGDEDYSEVFQSWPGKDVEDKRTVFCHIEGQEVSVTVQTEEGNEQSKYNEIEIKHVVRIVDALVKTYKIKPMKIAVLTQYRQQYNKIVEALSNDRDLRGVAVSTVIKSQGSEYDIVVMSTVRTLPWWQIEDRPTRGWKRKFLGFITDANQMNVALTRAREGLIIIGNMQLLRTDEHWRNLIRHYDEKGCIVRAREFLPKKRY